MDVEFAKHRVVLNEDRGDSPSSAFQLQVSTDGGVSWYPLYTTGGEPIVLKSGKTTPTHAVVTLPLHEIESGRYGAIVEGPYLSA